MNTITRLYNLLHTGNAGDITYYLDCCAPGMAVLELGCGNGRIAAALHQHGCSVDGLDNDSDMLDAFTQNLAHLKSPPRPHLADMRTFSLAAQYDRIIIPFNGLLCMLSLSDVTQVLKTAAAHLKSNGVLIFDVYYVPDDFENDGLEDDFYIDTAVLDDGGTRVEVYEKTLAQTDPQRFDTSYLFVTDAHSPMERQLEHTVAQRCLYLHQIDQCLHDAGLTATAIHPDFNTAGNRTDITSETQQLAIHARPTAAMLS